MTVYKTTDQVPKTATEITHLTFRKVTLLRALKMKSSAYSVDLHPCSHAHRVCIPSPTRAAKLHFGLNKS